VSRPLLIAALAGLVAAGVGHAQNRKKEPDQKVYTSPNYKFKTYFPEKDPKVVTRKVKTKAGELDQGTASVELRDGGVFSVSVTILPEAVATTDPKTVIDGVRDGIKGKDGKVEFDEPHEQGEAKTPGREMAFHFSKNDLRTRVFLVDNRLYQVTVTGSKSVVTGETAGKFLSAFEVTK
jgi:hypothetical protein